MGFAQGAKRCVYVLSGCLRELGAALCKQSPLQRAGEHRGEAAVARRRCRTRRQGTGMLVHEYVHVHISIRVYPYERIVFQSVSISPSVLVHALCTLHTRKVAFMHAYMKTCTYTDLMSERELRHEYPHPSEVFLCGYSRSMYLNVIQITLYLDDIRLIHTHTQTHIHTRKCNQVYRIYVTDIYMHALMCIHTRTCRTG